MNAKTRGNYVVGYVDNSYISRIGRRVYQCDMPFSPYDKGTETENLPSGGLLLDVWPTGRYAWVDSITPFTTPPPHNLYTPCHHEIMKVSSDCYSVYEQRSLTIDDTHGWFDVRPKLTGFNAVYYQSALWNYRQGSLYKPTDASIRQAQESALLNLWAGRPRRHMNVALALIELRDVKKTITQFTEFARFGIGVVKGSIKLPRHIASVLGAPRAASFSCQKLAEVYLWYNFGVRPTIDDISRFIRDVSKGRLIVGGRKRKPLLVGRTYANSYHVDPPDFTPATLPLSGAGGGSGRMTATYIGTPVKHVYAPVIPTNRVGFTVRKVYGKVFAKVREQGKWTWKYFPSDFNWSCPLARTAWELVPFSFVLDWFLDVGKSVQRLDDLSWVATTRFAFDEPWVTRVVEDTHYAPVTRGSVTVHPGKCWTNGRTGQSWQAYLEYTWRSSGVASYAIERTIRTFDRRPASDFGLTYASLWEGLIPEWQGKLKAYQISSGMALLESIAHLI